MKSKSFANYGGRGISVCERWALFSNFLEDMGEKPTGMTIERKDVNSGYSPENCCWANQETQDNNKRTTVFIELDGARLSMSQAAVKLNASAGRVRWAVQKYGDQWLSYVRAAAEIGRNTQ
jgi:hypothetical protein